MSAPGEAELAALLVRGRAQQKSGRHRDAVRTFGKALLLDRNNAALLCDLGDCLARVGDALRADEAYAEAIRVAPDWFPAYRKAADLARRVSGEAARAGQSGAAEELRRGAFGYLCALGVRLVERRDWREAEAAFRDASVLVPQDGAARADLGRCLCELGRLAEGEAAIRAGLALSPGLAMAHVHLGEALRRQNRLDEAEAAQRRAIALDSRLAVAHARLADLRAAADQADAPGVPGAESGEPPR
jgi:tetratricopeptide (TPR) repeat protein